MNAALLEAANAIAQALDRHGIEHAFIGGFAINALGYIRVTGDVDVLIASSVAQLCSSIAECLSDDPRFSYRNLKLMFTTSDGGREVPVETLPVGALGLPTSLKWFRSIYGVRVLEPGVLVLTKMKHCIHYIGSSRSASLFKLKRDEDDIKYLLIEIKKRHKTIDFVGYETPNPTRLYLAVQQLARY
ncbi:hypothetical protein F503_01400 [Ophiostoma piceae UAMH 11346]|uniref:Uncharacterized protein n=1 Tax=Ophiostoma piceae (strain UAMH 11346) TaxID=1262450 RepID=S3BY47_OPHP1|nr:hypothetical protein F503_01400 [Ophiostoma piceae UAMH 11346]